jgi:hypothetical protein
MEEVVGCVKQHQGETDNQPEDGVMLGWKQGCRAKGEAAGKQLVSCAVVVGGMTPRGSATGEIARCGRAGGGAILAWVGEEAASWGPMACVPLMVISPCAVGGRRRPS